MQLSLRDALPQRLKQFSMTDLVQMTRPDCESEFEANGYPFEALFLDEYITQMNSMDDKPGVVQMSSVKMVFMLISLSPTHYRTIYINTFQPNGGKNG